MPLRSADAGNVQALGEAFRRYRNAACLTQNELAAKTGMSQKKYSRIEAGEIQDPGLADVVRIGTVFGLTPDTLAELAGLWAPMVRRPIQDERWAAINTFMHEAPAAKRKRFLDVGYGIVMGLWQKGAVRDEVGIPRPRQILTTTAS